MNINNAVISDLPAFNLTINNHHLEVSKMEMLNTSLMEPINLNFNPIAVDMDYSTDSLLEEPEVLCDSKFSEISKDEFSYFLINMRENLELNQSEMAEKLGINKNSYNAFENGKRLPKNWSVIKDKVNYLVKNYASENRGFIHKKYINEEMSNNILKLHNRGKNIVQIGIELELDEEKVYDFLIENGFEPIEYTLNW